LQRGRAGVSVPKNQFATINVAEMNSPVYKLEIPDKPLPLTGAERGLTRSAFLASAAREKIESEG
jgi:hypothetical protein